MLLRPTFPALIIASLSGCAPVDALFRPTWGSGTYSTESPYHIESTYDSSATDCFGFDRYIHERLVIDRETYEEAADTGPTAALPDCGEFCARLFSHRWPAESYCEELATDDETHVELLCHYDTEAECEP